MIKKVSVVTALYKSAPYIKEFYERHLACLKQMEVDYEFVFVNDSSPDNSANVVQELIAIDKKVRLVMFSRNFGQYPAMFAGLAIALGDYIYTADCDLEEEPENMLTLWVKANQDTDLDFIYGAVKEREGGLIRKRFSNFFFNVMNWGTDLNFPKNMSWQILMKKQYAQNLLLHREAETLPAGLMILTGFKQDFIMIDKKYKGVTSYTFKKRFNLAINSVTAFSSKPLVYIGLIGIFITVLSFAAMLYMLIHKIFIQDFQAGWLSLIISIWLVGGLLLLSVGIIGIYLAKIFNQVKGRPLYIIKSIINKDTSFD